MKLESKSIVCAVAALSLSLTSVAFAQPDRRGDDGRGRPEAPRDHRDDHRHDRRAPPPPREMARHDGHGAGPDHNFYRGGRLPATYRSRQYVVDDWRGHRLSAPPRGYHWVQTGGDYVLVAITTGIIASILLNH